MLSHAARRLLACGLLFAAAPVSGIAQTGSAVLTTDSNGVGAAAFDSAKSVYLAVGPTTDASGAPADLADGTYYFQVTDASGKTLCSADSIAKRSLVVDDGAITAAPGGHTLVAGAGGAQIVQAWPFATQANSSGAYRLWLIHSSQYVRGGPNHGFPPALSHVTDFTQSKGFNSKAIQSTSVTGTVFYDINEDGDFDPSIAGEVAIPGWRIDIASGLNTAFTFTDADGRYKFSPEALTALTLMSTAPAPGYVGAIGGRWAPTSPTEVSIIATPPRVNVSFGVVYMVNTPQFATSKGFWHNAGEPMLAAADPQWREVINGLFLRKNTTVPYPPPSPDPTIFTVTEIGSFSSAYDPLSDYLVGPAKGVIANIFSTQVAAGNLNVACGPLAGKIVYVDHYGYGVIEPFEVFSQTALGLLSDPRSCDTGPGSDPDWLDQLKNCMNEWSSFNSTGGNIYTRDGAGPSFDSPY